AFEVVPCISQMLERHNQAMSRCAGSHATEDQTAGQSYHVAPGTVGNFRGSLRLRRRWAVPVAEARGRALMENEHGDFQTRQLRTFGRVGDPLVKLAHLA